ncbi:MAG: hypothetical protein N3A65_05800 [candidate division WOR-3 bacterium]|nr:hypothetical protein [candidate division WOR-3 bacterium]
MGGMMVMIDEGFPVFHNPAINTRREFNFVLGRWFYGTSNLIFGMTSKNNAIGIYYLNYGEIQGYNDYGIPTNRFTPYDMNIGYARNFGAIGFCIKNFHTRIDSFFFAGVVGGLGLHLKSRRLMMGAKLDNIGAELIYKINVPLTIGFGIKYVVYDDFDIFIEVKGKDYEMGSGILYKYENLKIFSGFKYIKPARYVDYPALADCWFSGGVIIALDEYEIGYSFIYTQFSMAHQIGIKLAPK